MNVNVSLRHINDDTGGGEHLTEWPLGRLSELIELLRAWPIFDLEESDIVTVHSGQFVVLAKGVQFEVIYK